MIPTAWGAKRNIDIPFVLVGLLLPFNLWSVPNPAATEQRAGELKAMIQSESSAFESREVSRRGLLEELDVINADQNQIRERISGIRSNHRELSMAFENLTMEYQKQLEAQRVEKGRLVGLARFLYKVKKEGFLKFVARGENLAQLAGRIRILYRTFRSHAELTAKLDARSERLKNSQTRIATVNSELDSLLKEMADQERLLGGFLRRKKGMVAEINRKQSSYLRAVREYRRVSSDLSQMFSQFDESRFKGKTARPKRRSLPFPLASGKMIRGFGKDVHEEFGTVVFHKGIEIGAEHNAPVMAVADGTVEFSGWLKGLGNVLIVNHAPGFYSLYGHLFKASKEKGMPVLQSETIGQVGDTGTIDRASLYFEIRENGKAVNPLAFFLSESVKGVL